MLTPPLTPGYNGEDCLGNGAYPGVECCCDECDFFLTCYPDWRNKLQHPIREKAAALGSVLILGFTNEFLPAFGTFDGYFSFSPGHANGLPALGTAEMPVLPVLYPVQKQ